MQFKLGRTKLEEYVTELTDLEVLVKVISDTEKGIINVGASEKSRFETTVGITGSSHYSSATCYSKEFQLMVKVAAYSRIAQIKENIKGIL